MLISRKLTTDKRAVTDFRHLKVRIAKNNLAYPLLKEAFSVWGSSKCEVLSVPDLKDAFHSLRLSENSKKYCGILPYFGNISYLYQRMPMGLNISPLNMAIIHHCNFQLSSEQEILGSNHGWPSVVYPIKEFSYHEFRRLIDSIIKMVWKYPQRNVSYLGQICITLEMRYS